MILMRGKVMQEKQGGLDVRKVILQNARHSARDYFIYLLTVTLALALMYAFHLLAFSDEIRALCSMLNTITGIVLAISLIVIFAVGWMISYMSRFILERRSREFALYMLSGIPNRTIADLFVRENILMGTGAFLGALVMGTFLYKMFALIIVHLFDTPSQIHVMFSVPAFLTTLGGTILIYANSLFRTRRYLERAEISVLLDADKQSEKAQRKNTRRSGRMFFVWAFALIAGGAVYYAGCRLAMTVDYSGHLVMAGLALFLIAVRQLYLAVTGFLAGTLLSRDKIKYKGNRLFLLRSLTDRLSVIGKTLGTLALLLTVTLFATQLGVMFKSYFDAQVAIVSGYDVAAGSLGQDEEDFKFLHDYVEEHYGISGEWSYVLYQAEDNGLYELCGQGGEFQVIPVMRETDFQKLRSGLGYENVSLETGKYLLLAPQNVKQRIREKVPPDLHISGQTLVYGDCLSDPFNLYGINGEGYCVVVPDEKAESLPYYRSCLVMNTAEELSAAEAEKLSDLVWDDESGIYNFTTNAAIENSMDSNTVIFVFPLFYVGLIFACIAAAILSVQQLSDGIRSRYRYEILSNLGMGERQIRKLIFRQLALYFALPVCIPIPAGIFLSYGINVLLFTELVSGTMFPAAVLISVGAFLVVYLMYFVAVYRVYARNAMSRIEEAA